MLDKMGNSLTLLMEHFQHATFFGASSNMWQSYKSDIQPVQFQLPKILVELKYYHPSLVCSRRTYIN